MSRKMIGLASAPRGSARQLTVLLVALILMGGLSACSATGTGNTGGSAVTANSESFGSTSDTGSTGDTGNTGNSGDTGVTGDTGNTGDFCSTHTCIANFSNGTGYIVQCADGEWSHSGGRPGACSDHGGETGNTPGDTGSTGSTGDTGNSGNTGRGYGGDPLSALENYWTSISNHDYGGAFNYLAPAAANLTEAQFVSEEQRAGIQSVSFTGHVAAQNGSTATVAVESLTTKDKQFGCRTWSGSYHLVQQSGQWLIRQASITPHACGG